MTERELWQRCRAGEPAAREEIILAHRHLVTQTFRKQMRRVPARFHEDLIGAGTIGLLRAVDKFDPGRGVKFTSYAITCIWSEMREWLRDEDWAPRSVREAERRGELRPVELISLEAIRYADVENADLLLLETLPDGGDTPDETAPRQVEAEVIALLVRCLPRRERKLIQMRYWEEETFVRIADRLCLSESRAHQIHATTLEQLKTLFASRGGIYAGP